jgi:hypothetical protein
MNVFLDTNIFFNIWRKEVNANGKQLWKGSKDLIDEIVSGRLVGYITSGLISTPTARRPRSLHSTAVVPEPAIWSSTRSPGAV